MNVKQLLALPFVPGADIPKDYAAIVDICVDIERSQSEFSLQLSNMYDRIIQDLPRSNNSVEGWHHTFNNRASVKHSSIIKLTKCILREQSRFEMDIERLYAALDARLKAVKLSYNVHNIAD